MKLYKLTNELNQTRNNTQWGEGITQTVGHPGTRLCSTDVIHAYTDINIALLMHPAHIRFTSFYLWEAKGEIVVTDGTKVGVHSLTTIKRIPLPDWYVDEKTRVKVQRKFAVLAAEAVLHFWEDEFPGDNRPRKAIEAAKMAMDNTDDSESSWAAHVAGSVAIGAIRQTYDSAIKQFAPPTINARKAARAASGAAYTCYSDTARTAANAANEAVHADPDLDLVALARQAVEEVTKEAANE